MTSDFSIRIGNIVFNTEDIPAEGLDYSKFDQNTKKMLSVFDKDDKKGHLSSTELGNLFKFLKEHDVDYTETIKRKIGNNEETETLIRKKNNILDDNEQKVANKDLKNKLSPNDRKNTDVNVENLATIVASQLKKQNIMLEKGLTNTFNQDYCKDKDGRHFKWNGTHFEYQNNVFFVSKTDKNGFYYTKEKIDNNGRFSQIEYDKDGNITSIQLKRTKKENGKNKTYTTTDSDFAAKKLGLVCPRKLEIEREREKAETEKGFSVYIFSEEPQESAFRYLDKGTVKGVIGKFEIYRDADNKPYIFLNNKFVRLLSL